MTVNYSLDSFKGDGNSLTDLKTGEIKLLFNIFEKLSTIKDQDSIRTEIFDDLLCLFNADFIASYIWDQEGQSFRKGVSANMSPDNLLRYEQYYQFCDPITAKLQKRRQATLVSEIMPQKELVGTEFFNDFLTKDGLYHGMNVYAYDGNLNIGDLRIWRARNRPGFEKKELSLLNLILPCFRNALRNVKIMTKAKKESSFWSTLLENTNTALFLFAADGKLVFQNRQALLVEKELTQAEYLAFYARLSALVDKNFSHTQWGTYFLSACSVSSPDKELPMTAVMVNCHRLSDYVFFLTV